MVLVGLGELVAVGTRNGCSMKVSQALLEKLTRMEALAQAEKGAGSGAIGAIGAPACGSTELLCEFEAELRKGGGGSGSSSSSAMEGGLSRNSVGEVRYWISRLLALVSLIAVLYFLFVHE